MWGTGWLEFSIIGEIPGETSFCVSSLKFWLLNCWFWFCAEDYLIKSVLKMFGSISYCREIELFLHFKFAYGFYILISVSNVGRPLS